MRSHFLWSHFFTKNNNQPFLLYITKESQGDITCDSLGDVTWSHGTHDVSDLSGRSVSFAATQLARQLHQERTQVVYSNKEAWKRLARRHSRNSCHMFVCIVVCACSRHALDLKMNFCISFVITKGLRDYFT